MGRSAGEASISTRITPGITLSSVKTILLLALNVAVLPCLAFGQDVKSYLGRWDITVTPATGTPYPQWLELTGDSGAIAGRLQPRGGAWIPIAAASVDAGKLVVTVQPAGQRPAVTWELSSVSADQLKGVEKRGDVTGPSLVALRAPVLDRPMPKHWSEPQPLFNGKDLTGWEPIGNVNNNKWIARDGELVNDNPETPGKHGPGAANIKTTAKFQDFKLHIEVNCPEGGNSGIYLRGRYEVQVGTEGGAQPTHEMGAIYSHYPPPAGAENGLGKWTAFDITFVGRHVTVLRDGKMYHDNVEIPGPTGGALDSDEGAPGPFYLQGDHHGVVRYRNITIQVPQP